MFIGLFYYVLSVLPILLHLCSMYNSYQSYYKYQCTIHPELLHEDEYDKRVFEVSSFEEAWGQLRDGIVPHGYLFRLIDYTFGLGGAHAGDDRQLKEGGFIIAKHASTREDGTPAEAEAIAKCEDIAKWFANRMLADSQNEHPLFENSINTLQDMGWNAQVVRNVGDGSYYGWLCVFNFSNYINTCLPTEGEADYVALTPHDI